MAPSNPKYKRVTYTKGDLEIQFVPNEEGGLVNSYLRAEYNGQFIGEFPDKKDELLKLRDMIDLVLKGKE